MKESLPIILDIEASGFGSGSYPIEVGLALADGSCESVLIHPEPEWIHWSEEAASIHKIKREMLLREGLPARVVAQHLNALLAGQTVYSDAWGFDSTWLSLLFYHAGVNQHFKLDSLRRLLTEKQATYWGAIKDQVVRTFKLTRHRAGDDARLLQLALRQVSQL
ncbi:hypothetical protein WH50_14390 [Pokkaliibacter plantistimulans]|uniref:Exonuclease domain-containing protein n=2 Tax=Pseudomonadota TaxID=1224 RepID=A0ABX5LZ96_9GAMM|nr:hypothetical protein [Pokkaliibacter plantistimulans]PPC75586.1 hypothetical protein C4K68_19480 [Pokkaliibacter plantistimulans]PXF30621.1 hypothetical protein WH50_14390 [Pokkaliibacter plantistimulans]